MLDASLGLVYSSAFYAQYYVSGCLFAESDNGLPVDYSFAAGTAYGGSGYFSAFVLGLGD